MSTAPTLLERIFEPVSATMTREAARQIADWRLDQETQSRIDELADKSNAGTLSSGEAAEYDRYLSAFDIAAVLQSKARSVLAESP